MVKIINGEIVQDNDPRLKQRNFGSDSSASSGAGNVRPGRSNVNDVFSRNNEASTHGGSNYNQGGSKSPPNPLDMVATTLGIQDRIITIPAIAPLQLTESKVGLVYILAVLIACFVFGTKAALMVVVFYVLWKKSDQN